MPLTSHLSQVKLATCNVDVCQCQPGPLKLISLISFVRQLSNTLEGRSAAANKAQGTGISVRVVAFQTTECWAGKVSEGLLLRTMVSGINTTDCHKHDVA